MSRSKHSRDFEKRIKRPAKVKAPTEDFFLGGADGDEVFCPRCSGEAFHLGSLGNLDHFRCRDCGTEFSHLAK